MGKGRKLGRQIQGEATIYMDVLISWSILNGQHGQHGQPVSANGELTFRSIFCTEKSLASKNFDMVFMPTFMDINAFSRFVLCMSFLH